MRGVGVCSGGWCVCERCVCLWCVVCVPVLFLSVM